MIELPIQNSRAPALQEVDSSSSLPQRRTLQLMSLKNCDNIFYFLEDFSVLVYRQYYTRVINLNKHLREQYAILAKLRKEIIERFRHLSQTDPHIVKLPEQLARLIQELGLLLNRFKYIIYSFLTLYTNSIRKYQKKSHQLSWIGKKSELFQSIKVQTFFRIEGL